jgi:5-deoxy-glucuronate isomerase
MSTSKWLFKSGELSHDNLDVDFSGENPPLQPWMRAGIKVGNASSGINIAADSSERILLIAQGDSVTVTYQLFDGATGKETLIGRASVFDGPADVLYLPKGTMINILGEARVIIGEAIAENYKPVQLMRKSDVPVFIRGAGRESRQIHNFCMPDTMDADRLICVEGIVPAGNWSGVPAHKHDCYIPGVESHLEEIYYFEAAPTKGSKPAINNLPFGYFRGYASDHRPFHLDSAVHHQDIVAIPHGYHGPVAAAPPYDLYFFNVMAGSDPVREWLVKDDPCHAWVRDTWETQETDPRLPYLALQNEK